MIKYETRQSNSKGDEKITDCINYLLLLQCILHQNETGFTGDFLCATCREKVDEAVYPASSKIGDLGSNIHGMGMPSKKESEEE